MNEYYAEIFTGSEKVNIKEAVEKMSDEFKKGLPELINDKSEWYSYTEEDFEGRDFNIIDFDPYSKEPEIKMPKVKRTKAKKMKSVAHRLQEEILLEKHKQACYSFQPINKDQQSRIYKRELERSCRVPTLSHPEIIPSDVKDVISKWREYNGECEDSIIHFDKMLAELDKRFGKLKFSWLDEDLCVTWKEGILENNKITISKVNIQSLTAVAKTMQQVIDDDELIENQIFEMVYKILEKVF